VVVGIIPNRNILNADEGERQHRVLKGGTFALQAHDPKSVIYYKDIMVKNLCLKITNIKI